MLNLKELRDDADNIIELLNRRGENFSYLREVIKLDERRREIIQTVESIKAKRNEISKKIGAYKRDKKDPKPLFQEISQIGQGVTTLEEELTEIEKQIHHQLLMTP
ncbi:MAG: serine--tRNA ligase, partial [Candidatus Izimaplasma sp.]|nr:serine--tRNA ligase [Candidatus Izimaplasma bacterium]